MPPMVMFPVRLDSAYQLPWAWAPVISQAWLTSVEKGSIGNTLASAFRDPAPASPHGQCRIAERVNSIHERF